VTTNTAIGIIICSKKYGSFKRKYPRGAQVGSQPGKNPVHTFSQWSLLTERGAHLRERVQDVFAELEKMLRELDRTRGANGTLTLAASTTVARYFMPRIFIRFHHYHRGTALHLIVGNTEEVLDHLRQQRVGLGLVEGHQRSPGVPGAVHD
jgi:DNA-binding transcriptional LysR family regulator